MKYVELFHFDQRHFEDEVTNKNRDERGRKFKKGTEVLVNKPPARLLVIEVLVLLRKRGARDRGRRQE